MVITSDIYYDVESKVDYGYFLSLDITKQKEIIINAIKDYTIKKISQFGESVFKKYSDEQAKLLNIRKNDYLTRPKLEMLTYELIDSINFMRRQLSNNTENTEVFRHYVLNLQDIMSFMHKEEIDINIEMTHDVYSNDFWQYFEEDPANALENMIRYFVYRFNIEGKQKKK